MKRLSIILTSILIMLLLLVGCGSSGVAEEPQVEEQVAETHYTENQTEMSNYMNFNEFYIANGWIYTRGFDSNTGMPLLLKMRSDSSDVSVLVKDVSPEFTTVKGEYIYSVLRTESTVDIYRLRLGGEDQQKIVSGATALRIIGDELYYCKAEIKDGWEITSSFCKSDLEGKNEEVLLEKEIYYPYLIDGILYYQDAEDNDALHKYSLETKEDQQINNYPTFAFILNDDYLYCIGNDNKTIDGDFFGTLERIDLETLESKTLYDGVHTGTLAVKDDRLFFSNGNDDGRLYSIDKNGENIGLVSQDDFCQTVCVYDDKLLYLDYTNDWEYVDGIYICNLDGSNKTNLKYEF